MYYIYKKERFWTGEGYSKDAAKCKLYSNEEDMLKDFNGGMPIKHAYGAMYAKH
jgi:hypothetical protein